MKCVAAILYAVAVAVLVAIALAFAGGGLDTRIALAALAAGAITAALALWPRLSVSESPRPSAWEWLAIVAFALFALRAFLWLVFTDGDGLFVLSPNNLGDLALHLTYIRHLASGVPFWPENPIFAHGPLIYPIGVDLFSALLLLVGVDGLRGFIWIGLAGAALTGAALWRWGRGFALLGFIANGGLMGFAFFATGVLVDFQAELAWKSLPLALLVTQRGLLFALPAGLLLLASWRSRYFGGEARDRLPWLGEWLLYSAMPVFHLHTFLFLSLLLAAWFVAGSSPHPLHPHPHLHPPEPDGMMKMRMRMKMMREPLRGSLLALVGAAFLPATVLTLLVTGMLRGASVLGWKPGWMWDDPAWLHWCATHLPGSPVVSAALLFWPMNFGVLPIFIALLCWRMRASAVFHFVWPALLVFLVCCFVKFAPWEWDNTKLMLWSYLAVLPFLWSEVLSRWPLWARALACFVLFWSGFASLLGGLDATHTGHEIARRSELDGVTQAMRALPPTERFAAYPTYDHPLLLAGRAMALGYPGHLWSHGLPYRAAEAQLEALMHGEDDWRAMAAALGVRYVFFGPREAEHYPDSAQPWKTDAKLVTSGAWGALYDLRITAGPPPASAPLP